MNLPVSTSVLDDLVADVHRHGAPAATRNVPAGNARGWGLEFNRLGAVVAAEQGYAGSEALARARGCLLPSSKLHNLYLLLRYGLEAVPGDIVELGTYKGGSAVFMADVLRQLGSDRHLWAFDSFEGMPDTHPVLDMHGRGDFADTVLEDLQRFIDQQALADRVHLVKGYFDASLPATLPRVGSVALAHIDCDLYEAVGYSIRALEPYLSPGAYLVFDDPLHGSCLGALQAVEEEVIVRLGLRAEQAYPHLVYRYTPTSTQS